MRLIPSLALLVISSVALFKLPAVADTYEVLAIGNGNQLSIYGMDDNEVVLEGLGSVFCSPNATTTCYLTLGLDGTEISRSLIPPILSSNMGGPMGPGCAPLPTDAAVSAFLCVSGYEAYIGEFPAPPGKTRGPIGVFNGPDPVTNYVAGILPVPDQRFLAENSFGDIVYDDEFTEDITLALDLTTHETPEPGTILLVGTGLLAAGSIRRRLFR
jgi:hypothetical protein